MLLQTQFHCYRMDRSFYLAYTNVIAPFLRMARPDKIYVLIYYSEFLMMKARKQLLILPVARRLATTREEFAQRCSRYRQGHEVGSQDASPVEHAHTV